MWAGPSLIIWFNIIVARAKKMVKMAKTSLTDIIQGLLAPNGLVFWLQLLFDVNAYMWAGYIPKITTFGQVFLLLEPK